MRREKGMKEQQARGRPRTQSVAPLRSRVLQPAAPGERAREQKDLSYGMVCKLLDLSETPLSHL